jgi:hypothetical protein
MSLIVLNWLPDAWPLWVAGALVVCWFVGAYNRLMRLRTAALQAYAAVDAALVRQLEFVQARAEAEAPTPWDLSAGASLQAAGAQLATMLAATRPRPLNPAGMAALGTAMHVLLAAWQHLHPDAVVSFAADGTLSRPAPLNGKDELPQEGAPLAWPEPSAAAEIARNRFNQAVVSYNAAIRQFPALLVAWIVQLRLAAPLR